MPAFASTRQGMNRLAVAVLDALLPPRCLSCGTVMESPGNLCPDCWRQITFISPPLCALCGMPFEFEAEANSLCGACTQRPPTYGRARAVFSYDGFSRNLVLAFKYGDRTDAAPPFGRWLARAGTEVLDGADVLVPVPLHWTRLLGRRYNQAALLAFALARETGISVVPDILHRRRRTPPQGFMTVAQRARNLRGAIGLRSNGRTRRATRVEGQRIVLVDDVMTTGATVSECARVLLSAGTQSVDVLTLARANLPRRS